MGFFKKGGRADRRYRHVGTLNPPDGFDSLITVSVGPDGIPVAMWAKEQDQGDLAGRYEGPGGATFPETRTSSQPRVALTRHEQGQPQPVSTTIVNDLPVAHPLVQPLPDGGMLVVGARCAWRESGPEQNALLVDADGSITRTGTLGDGIEHLLVDASGDIWIGYFDEGVFGNFGWGVPGPEPLGSAGIVKWSSDFEGMWRYEAVDEYWVADCYALNVADDQVWACTYSDFPIIRIRDQSSTAMPTHGVTGPGGLVVADDVIAIIGDDKDGGSLLTASVSDLPRMRRSMLGMPDGSKPPRGTLVCRGSVASLFVGRDWFAFDLSETT